MSCRPQSYLLKSSTQMARRRRGEPAPVRRPRALERRYRARLYRRQRALYALIMARLEGALDRAAEGERADSLVTEGAALLRAIAGIRQVYSVSLEPDPSDLSRLPRQLDLFTSAQVRRQLRVLGIQIDAPPLATDLYEQWIRENVALIRSLDQGLIDAIERETREAIEQGRLSNELRKRYRERLQINLRRARTIARDQVGKAQSDIVQRRYEDAGIVEYTWRHSGNLKTGRPEHIARDGKVFRMDDPPWDGHPGEAINCACSRIPIPRSAPQ